jgi:hypothetical protein
LSNTTNKMKRSSLPCGAAKQHGNVRRKRSVDTDETIYAPVREFFEHTTKLCETRATGTVRTMVGLKIAPTTLTNCTFQHTCPSEAVIHRTYPV